MYTHLVTPGVAPTLHARARFKLLIKLLFPTLGKPTKQEQQNVFTLDKLALNTERTWCYYRMCCLPTTPTLMAVFMSWLRQ